MAWFQQKELELCHGRRPVAFPWSETCGVHCHAAPIARLQLVVLRRQWMQLHRQVVVAPPATGGSISGEVAAALTPQRLPHLHAQIRRRPPRLQHQPHQSLVASAVFHREEQVLGWRWKKKCYGDVWPEERGEKEEIRFRGKAVHAGPQ